jgi:hypothetical protein
VPFSVIDKVRAALSFSHRHAPNKAVANAIYCDDTTSFFNFEKNSWKLVACCSVCRIKINTGFMALFVALLLCGSAAARSTPDTPTTPKAEFHANVSKNVTLSLAKPHTAVNAAVDKVKAAIQTAVKPVTAAAAVQVPTRKESAPATKESAAATNSQAAVWQQGGMMPGYGMPGYAGMPNYSGNMYPPYGGGMYVNPCIQRCQGLSGTGGSCYNTKNDGKCCCRSTGAGRAQSGSNSQESFNKLCGLH